MTNSLMADITFFTSKDTAFSLIKAEMLEVSNSNNQMILEFSDGFIYPNLNSPNNIQIAFKDLSHAIDLEKPSSQAFSLVKLLDFKNASNFIENQWNASIPLMLIGLMVLGFVFGRSSPRAGREGSVVTGVLVYIIYLSLLVAFRESYTGSFDLFYMGLWPIHFAILIPSILMFNLDGRFKMKAFMPRQRLKAIGIIFCIFILLIWLSK